MGGLIDGRAKCHKHVYEHRPAVLVADLLPTRGQNLEGCLRVAVCAHACVCVRACGCVGGRLENTEVIPPVHSRASADTATPTAALLCLTYFWEMASLIALSSLFRLFIKVWKQCVMTTVMQYRGETRQGGRRQHILHSRPCPGPTLCSLSVSKKSASVWQGKRRSGVSKEQR